MYDTCECQVGEHEVAGFIQKTYLILSNDQFNKIIFWASSGKEFVIKDTIKFQQIVLPKYFRHNKINSFIRQLNMYGFHKSRKQNTKSIFSHSLFIKNQPELLIKIKRKIKNHCCDKKQLQVSSPSLRLSSALQNMNQQQSIDIPKQNPLKTDGNLASTMFVNTNIVDNNNASFRQLLQKDYVSSRLNLNVSLNKISQNYLGDLTLDQPKDQDCLSIEEGIVKANQSEEFKCKPAVLCFENPTYFFNTQM